MRNTLVITILTILLTATVILSLGIGALSIAPGDLLNVVGSGLGLVQLSEEQELLKNIIIEIRIPRIIFCTFIGAVLGITGTAVQGIFRNPLAEPGLIGISAGASFFAAMAIVFEVSLIAFFGAFLSMYLISASAFIGALLSVLVVYRISVIDGRSNIATMILAGIAINALAGALTGLMSYQASEQQLRNITFWSLGSMAGATWDSVPILVTLSVVSTVPLLFLGKSFNLFSLGESQAQMMGLNTKRLKVITILFSTMAVGASVSFGGIIAFVGLLVPHALRLIGNVDNRFLLPASLLGGALILNLSDLIARTVVQPLELPIGVITAIIGAPVFIIILIRQRGKI